jgi:hypothetical protein
VTLLDAADEQTALTAWTAVRFVATKISSGRHATGGQTHNATSEDSEQSTFDESGHEATPFAAAKSAKSGPERIRTESR